MIANQHPTERPSSDDDELVVDGLDVDNIAGLVADNMEDVEILEI